MSRRNDLLSARGGAAVTLAETPGLQRSAAADPGADLPGATPLIYAARRGHCALVARLLAENAAPDGRDGEGATALHHAAAQGHVECLESLLQAHATVDAIDQRGRTPLMAAAAAGRLDGVTLLLQHGAVPDATRGGWRNRGRPRRRCRARGA